VTEFYNRTRRSKSLPLALLQRWRLLEIGLYYLLRQSDLAREGLENSGSYRFADHIYRGVPSGAGALGRWLDSQLLALPAARSFRNRFLAARDELAGFLCRHSGEALDVLSVPCGIPRELVEGAALARRRGAHLQQVRFHGLDLDPEVPEKATVCAQAGDLDPFLVHQGDALSPASYPRPVDFVTSTGLAEFLNDQQLTELYSAIFAALRQGGTFVSSSMQRRGFSDYLLKIAELRVHYRDAEQIGRLAHSVGFREVATRHDSLRIQTILVAKK
jgi:extracellular factor (EF) 3-hydroxypalmitic acid methyl ester biosynthesis protein